jgi:hypothetical protein
MTEYKYQNDASQAERRQVLKNTFHSHAQTDPDAPGGRFAKLRPVVVSGSNPSAQYPKLPPNSWSNSTTPVEPPLNQDVNEVPDLGFPEGKRDG